MLDVEFYRLYGDFWAHMPWFMPFSQKFAVFLLFFCRDFLLSLQISQWQVATLHTVNTMLTWYDDDHVTHNIRHLVYHTQTQASWRKNKNLTKMNDRRNKRLANQSVRHTNCRVLLCNTWNWSHDNDTVSGIEYRNTTAIPEVHTKRWSTSPSRGKSIFAPCDVWWPHRRLEMFTICCFTTFNVTCFFSCCHKVCSCQH